MHCNKTTAIVPVGAGSDGLGCLAGASGESDASRLLQYAMLIDRVAYEPGSKLAEIDVRDIGDAVACGLLFGCFREGGRL